MAKKKSPDTVRSKSKENESGENFTDNFEQAVEELEAALALMRGGDFDAARESFEKIRAANPDEWALAERAGMFARICERRTATATPGPEGADECYLQAVVRINGREPEAAIALLDRALAAAPGNGEYLYARSSAWALLGKSESAVKDLRDAIHAAPEIRFKASNDPDFDRIREEPAFIDIIEPSPIGV